ncbi:MAG: hypothetical protein ACK5X5_04995 [bacterium]
MQVAGDGGDLLQPLEHFVRRTAVEEQVRVDRQCPAGKRPGREAAFERERRVLHDTHAADVELHVLDVARKLRHVAEHDAGRQQRQSARPLVAGITGAGPLVGAQRKVAGRGKLEPGVGAGDAGGVEQVAVAHDQAQHAPGRRGLRRLRHAGTLLTGAQDQRLQRIRTGHRPWRAGMHPVGIRCIRRSRGGQCSDAAPAPVHVDREGVLERGAQCGHRRRGHDRSFDPGTHGSGRGGRLHLDGDPRRFRLANRVAAHERAGQAVAVIEVDAQVVDVDAGDRRRGDEPVVQVAMQARVEHAERERGQVGAGQVSSLVAGDAPGAAGIALCDHRFLLVVRQLARLDGEHVTSDDVTRHRRPHAALPCAEG